MFLEALCTIFTEDPDVVLIGEMQDLDSTAAALTVAQTGYLILSTVPPM